MKLKEQKKIAAQIIALESIIEANENPEKVKDAKNKIMHISKNLDPEDMISIDEIIQEQLSKKI